MKNCVVNTIVVFTSAAFIFFYSSFILATDVELSPLREYSSLPDSAAETLDISLVERFREQLKSGQVSESDVIKLKAALEPQNSGPMQEVMLLSADDELTPQKRPLLGEAQVIYSAREPSAVERLLEQITNNQLTTEDLASLRESLGLPNHLIIQPAAGAERLANAEYQYSSHYSNSGTDSDCCTCDDTCCCAIIIGCSIGFLTGMPHP